MQCGLEKRTIRRQEEVRRVECFKCEEKGHKCRECPLWKKVERKGVERAACMAMPQKVQ